MLSIQAEICPVANCIICHLKMLSMRTSFKFSQLKKAKPKTSRLRRQKITVMTFSPEYTSNNSSTIDPDDKSILDFHFQIIYQVEHLD